MFVRPRHNLAQPQLWQQQHHHHHPGEVGGRYGRSEKCLMTARSFNVFRPPPPPPAAAPPPPPPPPPPTTAASYLQPPPAERAISEGGMAGIHDSDSSISSTNNSKAFRKSCDFCTSTKIRCDGHKPSCSNCEKRSIICHYSQRKRPGPKFNASYLRSREAFKAKWARDHPFSALPGAER